MHCTQNAFNGDDPERHGDDAGRGDESCA